MLHFPLPEFERRVRATRAELERSKLDAILIFSQESHFYLTGFDTSGYKFFQCAVLTADETPITLLTRLPDLYQARLTSTIEDIRIWHDGEQANPALDLKNILEEKGLRGKRVGVELATYGLTPAYWEMVRKALEDWCALVDASLIVHHQRMVKSALELDYVRTAARLADAAMTTAARVAAPGVHEGAVEAAIVEAVLREGGDITGAKAVFASGPNITMGRGATGSRRLEAGEQLAIEWAGIYRRYVAGIYRTFSIGPAKPEHRALFRLAKEALQAMTEAARPGVTLGVIDQARCRVFDAAGFQSRRTATGGYSVGATFPPRGLPDHPPLLHPGNTMIARPGMTLFVHPVITDREANSVMNLGHTILITEDGCEVLSRIEPEYHECI